jgi:uncharacterized membrane protein YfhO
MSTNKIDKYQNLPETSRMGIQQSMFQAVFNTDKDLITNYKYSAADNVIVDENGESTIVQKIADDKATLTYYIDVKGTQTLYFDCFDNISNNLAEAVNGSYNVTVNGNTIEKAYPTKNDNGLLKLGTYTDENVIVEIEVLKSICAKSFGVAGVNLDTLNKTVSGVKTADLKQSENTITGTAVASGTDQYLFLPIPYDDGYSIRVNNQPAQIHHVFDAFMAVKLNNGNNTINISYVPKGFQTGIYITVAGILLFIILLFLLRRGFYNKIKLFEFPATILFTILFFVVLIGVYIFPVYAYLIF